MNYLIFERQFGDFPLVDMRDVYTVFPDFDRRRISEWQEKGYLKKVTNNFYVFSDRDFDERNLFFIANKIYEPSYVSLESALSYHSLIPEAVFSITSVSTQKTHSLNAKLNASGINFSYKRIKKELFFGYSLVAANGFSFLMADPEKAIIDFLYLREDLKIEGDFFELRLNEESIQKILNSRNMSKYLAIADSSVLRKKIKILKKIYA
jgi:predicted transcriptional regulator of viral defense system